MDFLVNYWNKDPVSFVIIGTLLAALAAIMLSNIRTPGQIYRNLDRATDKLASYLNVAAAAWIMMMAWLVLVDVVTLAMRTPIEGTREIMSNSVIVILFAQIPLAIRHRGMIRTTIIYDNAGEKGRAVIDGISYILGIIFFTAIAVGGWGNMELGWLRQELEIVGRGTLPLWPFRYVVVWFSVLSAAVYLLHFINLFVKTAAERAAEEAAGAPAMPE